MSDADLAYLTATRALELFRARKLSPVELLSAQQARIAATQDSLKAFSYLYSEEALAAARKAEAAYAGGAATRPLEGLTTAIKDESDIAGKITSNGSLLYKDNVAKGTAYVVQRLLDAGAVVPGRTATPEFSCMPFTHSRLWGVTRNPWNLDYTPGGSSGGAGAALAAGLTTLANGSDIGGSIRIPASASGVVGFKPPYGRVPSMSPFNLDYYNHGGPMARSVADCLLMQNVMAGPHPRDIASLKPKLTLEGGERSIKGWRIAYSIDLGYFEVDPEVRRNTLAALEVFRSLGATVEEVELGWTRRAEKAADDHLAILFGAWIAAYFDERKAQLTEYARVFGEASQSRSGSDLLASMETAAAMYDRLGPLLEDYNLLICPTLTVPSIKADFDIVKDSFTVNGKTLPYYGGWVMCYPFNMLSRCPVLNVPSGHAANGVPTGLQLVGRSYCDQDVFDAGLAYEAALGGWYGEPAKRPALARL